MKRYRDIPFLVLFSFLFFSFSHALEQNTEEPTKPKRRIPLFSFSVSANYFAPKFSDLNSVYQKIERTHAFPTGGDFKNFYSLALGVRFAPLSQQFLELEVGGSIYKAQPHVEGLQVSPTNFLQLYSFGFSYILSFPTPYLILSAGGGGGYVWLHSQRSYPSKAIARVNGELVELHVLCGAEVFHVSGASIGLRIGYSYATTVYPRNTDIDLTLKGLTVKVSASVPIVRI